MTIKWELNDDKSQVTLLDFNERQILTVDNPDAHTYSQKSGVLVEPDIKTEIRNYLADYRKNNSTDKWYLSMMEDLGIEDIEEK